jgi:hypothetical protein
VSLRGIILEDFLIEIKQILKEYKSKENTKTENEITDFLNLKLTELSSKLPEPDNEPTTKLLDQNVSASALDPAPVSEDLSYKPDVITPLTKATDKPFDPTSDSVFKLPNIEEEKEKQKAMVAQKMRADKILTKEIWEKEQRRKSLSYLTKYGASTADIDALKDYINENYSDQDSVSEINKVLDTLFLNDENKSVNDIESYNYLKEKVKDQGLLLLGNNKSGGSRKRLRRKISATRSHRGGSRKRPRRKISATRSHRGGSRKRSRRRM